MGVRRELKGWGGDLVGEVLALCAGSPGFNSSEPHTLKVVAQACNLSSQEADKQDKTFILCAHMESEVRLAYMGHANLALREKSKDLFTHNIQPIEWSFCAIW